MGCVYRTGFVHLDKEMSAFFVLTVGKKKMATLFLGVLLAVSLRLNMVADSAPTLYAFGDSTVDVGNNDFLPGASKANFFPYGVDFPGGTPTGRFTNGFNSADFVGQSIGLAMSPPPLLSVRDGGSETSGLNFVSAGSGILDSTGQDVISMAAQVKNFESVAMELAVTMGNQSASAFLAEALFFFRVGSNDLFLLASRGTPKDEIVDLLISNFRNQLTDLYNSGARKFAVMGTGLVGCTPSRRASNPSGACTEELNDLSFSFKSATKSLLEELRMSLRGFKYSFGDLYETTATIYANPLAFGFTEIKAACCGTGRFNAESGCTASSGFCSDRRQHFFWDGVHGTEAAYKLQIGMSFPEDAIVRTFL